MIVRPQITSTRHLTRRNFLASGSLALGAIVLAACGSSAPASAPTSAPAAQPTAAPAQPTAAAAQPTAKPAAQPTAAAQAPPKAATGGTVNFWHPRGAEGDDAFNALAKTFSDKSGINVKVTYTANETAAGANPKFLAAALGGNPPDIFMHDGSSYSTSVILNAFAPLDDYIKSAGVKSSDYFPFSWEKITWEGKAWGMPFDTDARMLYVNMDALQAAGFDKPPATIDELDAYAAKLTKKSGDAISQMGFIPWYGNWFLVGWAWDYGAKIFDPGSNKILLNAPEVVQALEWEVGYAKTYGVKSLQAFQQGFQSGAQNPFLTGQVSMQVTGNWVISSIQRYKPDLKYELAPAPIPPGKQPTTWSGGFVLGIPTGSKMRDAAWQFVQFLTSADSLASWYTEMGQLPTNVAAAKKVGDSDPLQKKFLDLLPVSHTEPVIPEWSLAWDEHVSAEQAAIYGTKSAKQALDDANQKVQDAIDSRLKG